MIRDAVVARPVQHARRERASDTSSNAVPPRRGSRWSQETVRCTREAASRHHHRCNASSCNRSAQGKQPSLRARLRCRHQVALRLVDGGLLLAMEGVGGLAGEAEPVSGWLGLCRWMDEACCLKAGARVSLKMCAWVRDGGRCHVRCGVSPTYGPAWVHVDDPPTMRPPAMHAGDAGRCLRRPAAPPEGPGAYCCHRCPGFAKGLGSTECDRGVRGCP